MKPLLIVIVGFILVLGFVSCMNNNDSEVTFEDIEPAENQLPVQRQEEPQNVVEEPAQVEEEVVTVPKEPVIQAPKLSIDVDQVAAYATKFSNKWTVNRVEMIVVPDKGYNKDLVEINLKTLHTDANLTYDPELACNRPAPLLRESDKSFAISVEDDQTIFCFGTFRSLQGNEKIDITASYDGQIFFAGDYKLPGVLYQPSYELYTSTPEVEDDYGTSYYE